jgi:hypothetical protein
MLKKIVSGGQTGADRAALDFAMNRGIEHGGYCPKGRLAEDGIIDARYCLQETSTRNYPQRTEKNVLASDATVIFTIAPKLTGGSKKTADFAINHSKPYVHLHSQLSNAQQRLLAFVREHHVETLNVAGSRKSKEPEIYEFVKSTLEQAFFPNQCRLV